MNTCTFLLSFACSSIGLVVVCPIGAATWYVDAAVSESGSGEFWETAFKTVQEGIDASTDGDDKHGSHPSHGLGLPAREMARIAYCMLRNGRWKDQQVIPKWFVEQTAAPTHGIKGKKSFGRDAESWSHGWELPARLTDERGRDIPNDARFNPGCGDQLIAFVPSLDLVVTRQTGSSGEWAFKEYVRPACRAVLEETALSQWATARRRPAKHERRK